MTTAAAFQDIVQEAVAAADAGGALPPVPKPAAVRDLGTVDCAELRTHVRRLSERAWQRADATKENRYGCFVHTRHIVFRFIPGNRTPLVFYSTPAWQVWQRRLLPVMAQAAAAYGYAEPIYPKAMLARLEAGHEIPLHVDTETGDSHQFTHKIHVPIETNPQATLTAGGADFHLETRHAFEVNNITAHGACNGGAQDRIHFIFEVFEGASAPRPKEVMAMSRRLPGVAA